MPTCGACEKKQLRCHRQGETYTRGQDLAEKCWNCLYEGTRCDGAKPKCGACVKGRRICQDQSETYVYGSGQDPAEKCHRCLTQRTKCDRVKPTCGKCLASQRRCRPPSDAPPQPQNPDDKCGPCLAQGRLCDRSEPTCGTCAKRGKTCYRQGETKPHTRGQDPADKCRSCLKRMLRCDKAQPTCGACKRYNRQCHRQGETHRRENTTETDPTVIDLASCNREEYLIYMYDMDLQVPKDFGLKRISPNQYSCTQCTWKETTTEKKWLQHEKSHSSESPYECYCDERYLTFQLLQLHYRRVH